MPVDQDIASAQLRAANLIFRQQGNIAHVDWRAMAYLLSNLNFARAQHPQQYAAAALPNAIALAPVATQ